MYTQDQMRRRSELMIFVGGLESTITNSELLAYFGSFGVIRFCEVQCWKNNPVKCRGFALLDVADLTTYENILLTPHRLNGRAIEVNKMILNKEELEEHTQDLNDRKIFVSNLPKKLTDVDLAQFFSQYGEIELAYIIKHHKDNKSKGFGFILYYRKEDKAAAIDIADNDGLFINGKRITCQTYVAKCKKLTDSNNSESFSPDNEFHHMASDESYPLPPKSSQTCTSQRIIKKKQYSLCHVETPEQYLKLNVRKRQQVNTYHSSMVSTQLGDFNQGPTQFNWGCGGGIRRPLLHGLSSPSASFRHSDQPNCNRTSSKVEQANYGQRLPPPSWLS